MVLSIYTSTTTTSNLSFLLNPPQFKNSLPSFSLSLSNHPRTRTQRFFCRAANQQSKPVNKKRKKKSNHTNNSDVSKGFGVNVDEIVEEGENSQAYQPLPLPKPPAGFVVDDQGRVLMVSNKRIATIVDSTNNFLLECIIRRVFRSSRGDECMLLCPVDTPVQILKSTNFDGWSAVSDEEVESILPSASYALAKIHMHLVYSGFCYTARGGFCYTEDDIFEFHTDSGEDVDGLPTEGVEITCFHLDGSHYMIYTPSDPLLFVATKDHNGQLQIVDDLRRPTSIIRPFPAWHCSFRYTGAMAILSCIVANCWPSTSLVATSKALKGLDLELLEDPATISAIDEETEFNALVEEEAALLESLLGER